MPKKFDLVVIGTGTAAATTAMRCRSAGWQVAMADSRPFGGTCALRGCDPKKVLVGAADVVDWARRMQNKGVRGEQIRIDWGELMRFKRTFTGPMPGMREQAFADAGIAAFHGRARFTGPTSVQVNEETLEGRYVLVASGAAPARLGIPGEEHLVDSTGFLELDELPRRILFVGGGYIAFEFAHLTARTGAQVTVLHRGARPLEGFDPDLVGQLVEKSRQVGIDVRLDTRVEAVEPRSGSFVVRASTRGRQSEFTADLAVHAAGRTPEIDDLGLEAAGIERERRGVKVNEYLQSVSNPAVYAAGDAAASGGPPLTPVAGYEGHIVAANLLEGNHQRPEYKGVATVVFTIPPLASLGLQEKAAREQGLRFRVNRQDTSGWYSSRRVAEDVSGSKVLIEEGSGRILGAHLLGPHADEAINVFALALHAGLTATDMKGTLFAYPTHGSDIQYML